jgi:anaerobic selenocysteine-containing dehydrogenase
VKSITDAIAGHVTSRAVGDELFSGKNCGRRELARQQATGGLMSSISRRDFLKYVGAGGVGAGGGFLFAEAIKKPVEYLVPQVIPPEDWSPGVATWYNTSCRQCSAGCGVSVRVREGRAKKIEGNPAHPVNQGRLCALGQSGLNALYNPDRIRGPLRLTGERGSGEYESISWDEAMTTLSTRLGVLKINKGGDRLHLLSGTERGHLDHLFQRFMSEMGSGSYLQYDYTHPHNLYEANRMCFGEDVLPYYDIRNSDFLISFGADYLGMWLSPVHHSLGFGHMRQGRDGHRGVCVQVEPRMSLSGASADQWVHAKPGSEGLLALAMAHAIVKHGAYTGADKDDWTRALASYSPASVAEATGIAVKDIEMLAGAFGSGSNSLAIGGGAAAEGPNGLETLVAVNVLNHIGGSVGRRGGIIFNAEPMLGTGWLARQASYRRMQQFAQSINSGEVEILLLHGTNPVFNLPESSGLTEALGNVEYIVGLSSFMDETTLHADLILPTDVYLESWGDDVPEPGVGIQVATISQPTVTRVFDTRPAGDIILQLAHQVGGELPAALPWATMEEYVRDAWRKVYLEDQGAEADFDQFWNDAVRSGVWARTSNRPPPTTTVTPAVLGSAGASPPVHDGAESEYPFVLTTGLSQTFLDGRGANLPWQQELPDPLTSIVYGSWVELNPETARQLDLAEGDVVEVSSSVGSVEAPVFVYQAIRPDVVAMPLGQGHRAYGRYAKGRGVNPIDLMAEVVDDNTGALATGATRVRLTKTGRNVKLVKTDGVSRDLGRQILGPAGQHS